LTGLKNAPATVINGFGFNRKELFIYMDNIVIYATLEEHERKYNLLIKRFHNADLKLQPEKKMKILKIRSDLFRT